jgi:hypothetical protein
VTLCVVCTMHVEMRSECFLIGPQNQGRRFVSALALKPLGQFSPVDLKTGGDGFSWFCLKVSGSGFPFWASKPATTVW